MINVEVWKEISAELKAKQVRLVAVSKQQSLAAIRQMYDLGQRDFGENYVQELLSKQSELPEDIRWHFIGHLQRNKVKQIIPFISLIHSVDRLSLLQEIQKQAASAGRVVDVLLQVRIAQEETKYGMSTKDLMALLETYEASKEQWSSVRIRGLMGMATFTEDQEQIRKEFMEIKNLMTLIQESHFLFQSDFSICSMGMSSDYPLAIECGSNMVRMGSLLFGARGYWKEQP